MTNEVILDSRKWGLLRCYPFTDNSITVYAKVNESDYRYYRRDSPFGDTWSAKEVDWRGYIMGARSLRFDFDWELDKPITLEAIEPLIQAEHDDDDVASYHVEPVHETPQYENMDNKTLWGIENDLHTEIGDLEIRLRELRRTYAAVWEVGDRKFDWASQL